MASNPELDIALWGATGFVGRRAAYQLASSRCSPHLTSPQRGRAVSKLLFCGDLHHPPACGRVARNERGGGSVGVASIQCDVVRMKTLSGPESPTLPEGE